MTFWASGTPHKDIKKILLQRYFQFISHENTGFGNLVGGLFYDRFKGVIILGELFENPDKPYLIICLANKFSVTINKSREGEKGKIKVLKT